MTDSRSSLRPPDPPLQTGEQAGSASLTVTHIPIELVFFFTTPNPPPPWVLWGVFLATLPRFSRWSRRPGCLTAAGGGGFCRAGGRWLGCSRSAAPCVWGTQPCSALIFQPCASKSDVTQITGYFSINTPSPACAGAPTPTTTTPLFSVLRP